MKEDLISTIRDVCLEYGNDRSRLMDVVRVVQAKLGCVSDDAIDAISSSLDMPRVAVESLVTFYAFFSKEAQGNVVIRLCNDVIDRMQGADEVTKAFEAALGVRVGETTRDGKFTLEHAPCIGMCDQAPAALVNDVVVTHLSPESATAIVAKLRETGDPGSLVENVGDGQNANELVRSMVKNNVRKAGPVLLIEADPNAGLLKTVEKTPEEVIKAVKTARLRGRGGAGFPTGMKWEFTRGAQAPQRFVICNADEGEPGTFKDRILLTERPELMFAGMTIAGYAIGAEQGIVYLRGEYTYLLPYLETLLAKRRAEGLLGTNVAGKEGFNFDIRIQMGAGAYVCGEETALISSCEGLRGDPKNRPPFPAQKGYLGNPTTVNNVETFCCTARIMEMGPEWFAGFGNSGSSGTKLLSVSGDCRLPGVYEVEFGTKLKDLLEMVGADDAAAVQVGGPSGQMVGAESFDRAICFEDLATGGSVMVFGKGRDVLDVAHQFMEFFNEETCGYCTPCRAGNVLLQERLATVMAGKGTAADLAYLEELGTTVKFASRCGLGQTSPNPILTTLQNFRAAYEARLTTSEEGLQPTFDIRAALGQARDAQGRDSVHSSK